ncbi:IclR family transcriptional regulator [Paraburkholderia acidipaludis]|uniref:IclR family transcriptional regulator n=1 Tax=Paraburkholderia acidipaludis TaxID=660537 RepID=UPI000482159B|nr:IclR family transcriptional regulator [Paraburkholderia acidipaludis]
MATNETRKTPRTRVQSAETGAEILKALASLGPSASLTNISEAAGMVPAKAHRYLQAMIVSGLATQEKQSGRYALGPAAVAIGLAALAHIDVVGNISDMLPDLRDETGHTCFVAVWANHGPTVVRVVEMVGEVTVLTRAGATMPLLRSATGLTFAAHLSAADQAPVLATEPDDLQAQLHEAGSPLNARLAAAREHGIVVIEGLMVPGIAATAVPIFDARRQIAAVVTAIGPFNSFDSKPDGPLAQQLKAFGKRASQRLGAPMF